MQSMVSVDGVWSILKNDFKALFPGDIYHLWFEPLECLQEDDSCLRIGVPNDFAAIWIEDNYLDFIRHRVRLCSGRSLEILFEVIKGPSAAALPDHPANGGTRNSTDPEAPLIAGDSSASERPQPFLNPKNRFEEFVVGPGNELAHAAAIAVANAPGKAYNPLFLYGETGLGKTHLMHAVAHQVLKQRPKAKIVYVSTEKFTNEFIRAIQENNLIKFRKRYREVDVLLIDDIHFLSGKERIQEEFFHTFNEVFEGQRQIFLSSDRPAGEINKLESRLVSRFQWGLVADVQPPDLETRLAILHKKAQALNLALAGEVLSFLAQNVSRNVRRMEGALNRVASYATLMRAPVDLKTVQDLLKDVLQEQARNLLTVEAIQQKVADHYRLTIGDLLGRRRPAHIAFPRQVAMYLCRTLTGRPLGDIGQYFGGRDHGTVIHACKAVENMMEQDKTVKGSVDLLSRELGGGGSSR